MKRSIFRKYDIRGIFEDDLSEEMVSEIGMAIAVIAKKPVPVIAVGRDCRLSGSTLFKWLTDGMRSCGSHILDLGVQTTPMTYYAAHHLKPDFTVMITGSHNPPEYNGFKLMRGNHTLFGDEIQTIADTVEKICSEKRDASGAEDQIPGTIETVSIRENYFNRLFSEFCFDRSLKIVIDAGNGTAGELSCRLLEQLGCRVIPLFCRMDGTFPNHHPDPTVEENLRKLKKVVISEKADIGVAYDGDGDRLGVVDEKGNVIWGDRILIILARALLHEHAGATILSEVKASSQFYEAVEKAGGKAMMCATGHSIIKERMLEENSLLAGEMSGHMFFRDRYFGFDDALYATLRLLEIIADSDQPLSNMLSDLPDVYSTPEIREQCSEEQKFILVNIVSEKLKSNFRIIDIDGARVEFPKGWGLIRASNTQPVIVMRFEATSKNDLEKYEEHVRNLLNDAKKELI